MFVLTNCSRDLVMIHGMPSGPIFLPGTGVVTVGEKEVDVDGQKVTLRKGAEVGSHREGTLKIEDKDLPAVAYDLEILLTSKRCKCSAEDAKKLAGVLEQLGPKKLVTLQA